MFSGVATMLESPQSNIDKFFSDYPIRKYPKGQILLYFEEEIQYVYYLESGKVRQYNVAYNGNEIVLNIYRNKTFFPLYLVFNKVKNEYIFEAMTNIEIRAAPINDFIIFFTNTPEVVLYDLKNLYKRSNKTIQRMTNMASNSAYFRIVFELVNECSHLKKRIDGSYRLYMHEYELADSAGLSRETTSREFQKLKERKLAKVNRRFIVVKNLEKLKLELKNKN
jgi:CRP/FNR family cyclic AMP-dependent transcriptional regulator